MSDFKAILKQLFEAKKAPVKPEKCKVRNCGETMEKIINTYVCPKCGSRRQIFNK